MRNDIPVINVYKKNNIKSGLVTQLLYGENFKKIKKKGKWFKIKNNIDNYKGYIKIKKYTYNKKNTHKICSVSASLYSSPNNKSKIKKKLSFGSKIRILKKKGNFYKIDNFWVKKK